MATEAQVKAYQAELEAKLAALQAENAKLKASKVGKLTLKVSEKGGLSVYGLGRFPVTLYAQQWERLLDMAETIRTFLAENKASLTTKE
jgi:uncharacterized small protein (DUF1192 family)